MKSIIITNAFQRYWLLSLLYYYDFSKQRSGLRLFKLWLIYSAPKSKKTHWLQWTLDQELFISHTAGCKLVKWGSEKAFPM